MRPGGSDRERDQKIRDAYEKPQTHIDRKTIVRAAAGSPYAVEVLVKKDGKYVPAK